MPGGTWHFTKSRSAHRECGRSGSLGMELKELLCSGVVIENLSLKGQTLEVRVFQK